MTTLTTYNFEQQIQAMTKTVRALIEVLKERVAHASRFVREQNERQVALWGSSLQYKRRYTNPDTAKAYRGRMFANSK